MDHLKCVVCLYFSHVKVWSKIYFLIIYCSLPPTCNAMTSNAKNRATMLLYAIICTGVLSPTANCLPLECCQIMQQLILLVTTYMQASQCEIPNISDVWHYPITVFYYLSERQPIYLTKWHSIISLRRHTVM